MGVSELTLVQDFHAPAERVFLALADQERMGEWMRAKISVPVRGPNGLVGTVRRIHVGLRSLDERIVECEAPRFIAYEIVTPVPLLRRHRGEVRVESLDAARSRVRWRVVMDFEPRFVGGLVVAVLRAVMGRALARLAKSVSQPT